jgi:D-glycero-alpha-D-manno-heptose-7-phosphate kinase
MIVTRTPYRISLFGGGTDFPAWYKRHGGAVLATTIDKFSYLSTRYLPPFIECKYRIVWAKIEACQQLSDITHPAIPSIISHTGIEQGLEIHHQSDLPSRSGMGSSSAFTVGLLKSLYALQGKMITKRDLALQALHLEQDVLKEFVGSQDQICAAYGGLNHIVFQPDGDFSVMPCTISKERITQLENHLMLFYTGIKRTSSEVQKSFVANLDDKKRQLRIMNDLVDEAIAIVTGNQDITALGELLQEAWDTKRSYSKNVSNSEVDALYNSAIEAGAVGGKLTGAGGGGFMLLFVPPEKHERVRAALSKLIYVPFHFEFSGSQVIFADHETDYSDSEVGWANQPVVASHELQLDPEPQQ